MKDILTDSTTKKRTNSLQQRLQRSLLRSRASKPERELEGVTSKAHESSSLLPNWQPSMSSSAVVQTKLTVNEPDDQYEQEAERVADTVMRMPSRMMAPMAPPPSSNTGPPPLGNPLYMSREKASKGSEESFRADEANQSPFLGSSLMRMPVPSYPSQSISTITQMSPVQAQIIARAHAARAEAVQSPPPVTPQLESRIQGMNGGGSPLPQTEQNFFAPKGHDKSRMGADLSGVRVHTDSSAVQTSRDLNARAFTVGNNIAFNSGEYQPGSTVGRHLLAHELTHTVQQGGAGRVQRQPIDSEELEAIRKRYEERTEIYREYYNNPKYEKQEEYFGKAIVNVLIEIKNRLDEFEDARWIDGISDFLQKRWLLGVQGVPAFKAKYGEEALKKYENSVSSDIWEKGLQAAEVAETNPEEYDTDKEQRSAMSKFPKDIRDAFETLKNGDAVFDDDKEYATYLQTIAHDYIDLSDAMIECGCGSEKDWALLIDILTDESAEGFLAWMGDVSGVADESLENFLTLTMKRATILSLERNQENLVCPDID